MPVALSRFLLLALVVALLSGCGKAKSKVKSKPAEIRNDYVFGTVVGFGRGGASHKYKRGGWGETERDKTWTNSRTASLVFTLPEAKKPLRLRMRLAGFTFPRAVPYQPIEVYANDEKIADWQVSEMTDYVAIIPSGTANHVQFFLELRIPQATSAKTLGLGEDVRVLGVSCYEMEISETNEDVSLGNDENATEKSELLGNAYTYGTMVNFGAGGGSQRYKVSGWYTAEKDFTWMGRDVGVLELKAPPTQSPLILKMKLAGMITPGTLPLQPVHVYVNKEKVAEWQVGLPAEFATEIPANVVDTDGRLRIELYIFHPTSPKELGIGGEVRPLSIRCESLTITEGKSSDRKNSPTPAEKAQRTRR